LKLKNLDPYKKIDYRSAKKTLLEMQADITNINKKLQKKENLEALYNKAMKYKITL
jgi:hypothetical protein